MGDDKLMCALPVVIFICPPVTVCYRWCHLLFPTDTGQSDFDSSHSMCWFKVLGIRFRAIISIENSNNKATLRIKSVNIIRDVSYDAIVYWPIFNSPGTSKYSKLTSDWLHKTGPVRTFFSTVRSSYIIIILIVSILERRKTIIRTNTNPLSINLRPRELTDFREMWYMRSFNSSQFI